MSRSRVGLAAGAVALISILPVAPGLLSGEAFYFRDLSNQYLPQQRYAVEGLRQGELRYWNPYVHEGEALFPPPLGYPLDLLQIPFGDERGLSALLALHVPLGAVAALLLGRGLGLSTLAAAGGGLVYALGGFYLSSLNLFVHLRAAAWAPLVALGLLRAASGGRRDCVAAAIVVAIALSTGGLEVTAQAIFFGIVISLSRRAVPRRLGRIGASLLLGLGLAAPVWLPLWHMTMQGARSHGLPDDMALAFSVPPAGLGQAVVAGLFAEVPTSLRHFWGHRFFAGFPYFLSLYLGAATLGVALVGAVRGGWPVSRLVCLGSLGLLVSLGPAVRLDLLLEAIPPLRAFRFPSKAFFMTHLAASLLVARGLHRLRDGAEGRSTWRLLAVVSLASGLTLLAAPLAPVAFPEAMLALSGAFFPEGYSQARSADAAGSVLRDAAAGGLSAFVLGLTATLVLRNRLRPGLGTLAAACLIAADLLRAGAGLNPTLPPSFFEPSPQMRLVAAQVAQAGGRLFTCQPASSLRLFGLLNESGGDDHARMVNAFKETQTPYHNMTLRVRTALSEDRMGLAPGTRALSGGELGCAAFPDLVARLRRAGVSHVLALDPILAPGVVLERVLRPRSLAGLSLGLYGLASPLPLRQVAREVRAVATAAEAETLAATPGFQASGGTAVEGVGTRTAGARGQILAANESSDRIRLTAKASQATVVVIRDAYAAGWTASVNGAPAPVLRADGRHRAVPIPAGRSEVVLTYRPPGLGLGCALATGSVLIVLWVGYGSWIRRASGRTGVSPALAQLRQM